jgi:hypothetical protein
LRGISLALSIAACGAVCSVAWAVASIRIFVEPFPDKPGGAALREAVVSLLSKEQGLAVVTDAAQADFIVSGSGETYVRGYVGTNPRVHYLNRDAKPIYGGFLSVELKPRGQDTVWSYLATPRRLGPQDIDSNLARQVAHKLAEIAKGAKP